MSFLANLVLSPFPFSSFFTGGTGEMKMKKTILVAGLGAAALFVLLHKKAPFVAQFTPLDANMSQDVFAKWQTIVLSERDPDKLHTAADLFQTAGFPNSAAQIRAKEQAVRAGSA